jgi:lincosamide nucleotidyltransferase A/C/D/E
MNADDVLAVLATLTAARLAVWLDGGWGVDALLGEQTRPHEDVDIVVELGRVEDVAAALRPLGFTVTEDYLPTRAVLRSDDGRQIDLHPVTLDHEGTGWQAGASPDGTDCPYPADEFGLGRVAGREVPCLTAVVQVEHHAGYEPRERDRQDMAALAAAFGVDLRHRRPLVPEPHRRRYHPPTAR